MDLSYVGDILYFAMLIAPFCIAYWVIGLLWDYIREYYWLKWYFGNNYITLEIKLPKEQLKTPQAMELVFNALWEPGDSNGWKETWLNLNTLPICSFEVASIGGSIHFFFWVPDKFKPRVEAHIYAQFPQAEVVEVPDYTRLINFNMDTHKIMGFDYAHTAKNDPIPIKTYKMLGLDKPAKEEEKVDPITQTIEVMASIGPHENMWWQIVARPHKTKYKKPLTTRERFNKAIKDFNPLQLFYDEYHNWDLEVDKIIDDVYKKYEPKDEEGKKKFNRASVILSVQDGEFIKMVTENASKIGYEVGMRTIYFARKEHFDGRQPGNMGSMFKAYGAGTPFNGFRPAFVAAANDKWWEPGHANSVAEIKALMFPDYAGRRYFNMHGSVGHGFYKNQYKQFVLSTEELATLYHFPGSVSQTPTFERIGSATAEAPANLPVGEAPSNLPM